MTVWGVTVLIILLHLFGIKYICYRILMMHDTGSKHNQLFSVCQVSSHFER